MAKERNQPEKSPYCVIPTLRHGKGKTIETVVAGDWASGGGGGTGRTQRLSGQ